MLFNILVSKLAESRSLSDWRVVDPEWLNEGEERQLYTRIKAHVTAFRSFPDLEALKKIGFVPPDTVAENPTQYYLQEIANRHAWRVSKEKLVVANTLLKSKSVNELRTVIDGLAKDLRQSSPEAEVDFFHESSQEMWQEYLAAKKQIGLSGIPTGFPSMDATTSGLQPGDLVVIAGRPNIGKSYILMRMVAEAFRLGIPSLFVTLEMMVPAIRRRFMGLLTGINPTLIREGQMSSFAEQKYRQALSMIENGPPLGFCAGNMKKGIGAIETLMERHRPDVMFIDAAYLLRASGRRREKTHEELQEVIRELAAMAKSYARPFVITVQLNREAKTTKKNMIPGLEHLAGSDSMAQDASVVYGVTRYAADDDGYEDGAEGRRTLHHMKCRDGEMKTFHADFQFNPVRVEEIEDAEITQEDDNNDSDLESNDSFPMFTSTEENPF
jgi:replicative DNA helicase